MRLSRFVAMTFDVHGTLIDWVPASIGFPRAWADAAKADLTFGSLAELVVAHRAESAGAGLRT